MPVSTRQRLIDAANVRFYRDGFRNVGLDQILSDVGISKTAFYKHFDCKESLMLAVLEAQDLWLRDNLGSMIEEAGGDCPREQLLATFDVVYQIIESDEFQGCIFVNAVMEFPLPHDPAHQAAAESKRAIERILESIAERAGAERPRELAEELCLIMEGTYVTRQVYNDPAAIEIARRLARRAIDTHCPTVPVT